MARLDGRSGFWAPTDADQNAVPPAMFLQVSQMYKQEFVASFITTDEQLQ